MPELEVRPLAAPSWIRTETSLLYAVKRLELAIRARLDEVLKDAGVTTLQYTALTVLETRDGTSAAQLARDSFVTPQSMGDMLRLLEGRGLIARRGNPANRREVVVHITRAGRALLREHGAAVSLLEQRMTRGISASDAEHLREILLSAWEAMRTPGSGDAR